MSTAADLVRRFTSFGPEVPANIVPELVRDRCMVWSFGYGTDDDSFTTIQTDDLWAFEGATANPDVVADWGPFRLALDWECPGQAAEHWMTAAIRTEDDNWWIECGHCGYNGRFDNHGEPVQGDHA